MNLGKIEFDNDSHLTHLPPDSPLREESIFIHTDAGIFRYMLQDGTLLKHAPVNGDSCNEVFASEDEKRALFDKLAISYLNNFIPSSQ